MCSLLEDHGFYSQQWEDRIKGSLKKLKEKKVERKVKNLVVNFDMLDLEDELVDDYSCTLPNQLCNSSVDFSMNENFTSPKEIYDSSKDIVQNCFSFTPKDTDMPSNTNDNINNFFTVDACINPFSNLNFIYQITLNLS